MSSPSSPAPAAASPRSSTRHSSPPCTRRKVSVTSWCGGSSIRAAAATCAAFDPPKVERDSVEWLAALNANAKFFRSGEGQPGGVCPGATESGYGRHAHFYVDQWEGALHQGAAPEVKKDEKPVAASQRHQALRDVYRVSKRVFRNRADLQPLKGVRTKANLKTVAGPSRPP